jgi:hypothetical protein
MPNLNGTGPLGKGSMTGKKLGKCRKPNLNITEEPATDNKEKTIGLSRSGLNRGKGFRKRGGGGFGGRKD